MKAPRKPWEKDAQPESGAQPSLFGDVVDKEFPPLSDEHHSGGSA
jgi:hypothetical protein